MVNSSGVVSPLFRLSVEVFALEIFVTLAVEDNRNAFQTTGN